MVVEKQEGNSAIFRLPSFDSHLSTPIFRLPSFVSHLSSYRRFPPIKSVLGMTWLSCHTPEMLERELMVYFLAYNIVRITMCDAANIGGHHPRDLSFKGAKDAWLLFGQDEREPQNYAWLLWTIADVPLRKRPGRNEPRKIKRRNGKYERMSLPRSQEKAALSP